MKTWQKGTAFHIAVFLLVIVGGCYTTLRSPSRLTDSIVNETRYEQSEWDFGRGWYYHSRAVGSNYFYYHSMPWWYNRNRNYGIDTTSAVDKQSELDDGKIARRNFDNVFPSDGAINIQPNTPPDSATAVVPATPLPDSAIKYPVSKTEDKKKETEGNKRNSISDKINHRGRR